MQPTSVRRPWLRRLGRLLGFAPLPADVSEELAALRGLVAGFGQTQAEGHAAIAALRESVERLERQLNRAGKEQFKANALADAQQQTIKSMLEQLKEAESYRERELANLRERLAIARGEGRRAVIERLLPVADGLSEAVLAGDRLLTGDRLLADLRGAPDALPAAVAPQPPATLGQRLNRTWGRLWGRPATTTSARAGGFEPRPDHPVGGPSSEALVAWLAGLRFVEDRLLEALAADGVRPIETEGDLFDPNLHIVVETVPASADVPPGVIARELRRGYIIGDAVLRYAEVVVAR